MEVRIVADLFLVLFLCCCFALFYINAGYYMLLSGLLSIRNLFRSKPTARFEFEQRSVTFIIPVHNEGRGISRKLANLTELDYPREMIQVIVVSDASTDDTAAQARSFGNVEVIELRERSGKSAALNAGLDLAEGELIAFTDVAAMLASDALRAAAAHFADCRVGCVSSEDSVIAEGGVGEGESFYNRMDIAVRRLESSISSATGMSGSFYLVRRDLCPSFPADVATDMYSALYCVNRGYRAIVEPISRVTISAQPQAGKEFRRKVRTMVTGLRAIFSFPRLLNPAGVGVFALCLWSHKLMRYFSPAFALGLLVSTLFLAMDSLIFSVVLALELCVVCISLYKINVNTRANTPSVVNAAAFFCLSLAATAVAWFEFFRRKTYVIWQPTERSVR